MKVRKHRRVTMCLDFDIFFWDSVKSIFVPVGLCESTVAISSPLAPSRALCLPLLPVLRSCLLGLNWQLILHMD